MNYLNTLLIILILVLFSCKKEDFSTNTDCYRGKIVLSGICSNITVQVTSGNLDPDLYEKNWVNPATNTAYENVFRLLSVCTFPTDIKEGQEFNFKVISQEEDANCAVCLAYYPTPTKGLYIKVCD